MKTARWIGIAAVLATVAAVPASTGAADPDVRYFYGKVENRAAGDLRFKVSDGRVFDIVANVRSRCFFKGEPVGKRAGATSGFDRRKLRLNGRFRSYQAHTSRYPNGRKLEFSRKLHGKVSNAFARARIRINYETGPLKKRVSRCRTGKQKVTLDLITASEYRALRDKPAPLYPPDE